jgi:DnaJ-class molecular chaperone
MSNTKYYTLLGLNKSDKPSSDHIKKAYKKKALKWHPDRNKDNKNIAENKFKEISEAYQILSDPNKKTIYDQYGEAGIQNCGTTTSTYSAGHFNTGSTYPGLNPHDVFRNVFGNSGINNIFTQTPGSRVHMRSNTNNTRGINGHRINRFTTKNSETQFNCSLEELFNGTTKKMKITESNGSSQVVQINVKKGWKQGTKITYPRVCGGSITFVLKEKPHRWFKRIGNDLVWICNITSEQAQNGIKLTIPTLNHDKLKFKVASGEIPNGISNTIITGKGMPIKGGQSYGNLIINFVVK